MDIFNPSPTPFDILSLPIPRPIPFTRISREVDESEESMESSFEQFDDDYSSDEMDKTLHPLVCWQIVLFRLAWTLALLSMSL